MPRIAPFPATPPRTPGTAFGWALLVVLTLCALLGPGTGLAAAPDLPAPSSAEDAAYLGVPEGEPFPLSAVRAEAVLVEHFSMYCPHCQHEAPALNELFRRIQASPLAGRLKVIGVGAGNTDFETEFFRKKYEVPFPLFPDADFARAKAFRVTATPTYVLVRVGGGRTEVLKTVEGRMDSPEKMMDMLLETLQ